MPKQDFDVTSFNIKTASHWVTYICNVYKQKAHVQQLHCQNENTALKRKMLLNY